MAATENQEAIIALQRAIDLEKKGQKFYNQAAKQSANRKGSETFRSLAEDEVMHERVLTRQLDRLTQGQGYAAVEGADQVLEPLPLRLFPADDTAFRKAVRPEDSDLDALIFALQIENDSYSLYRSMAGSTNDPTGKRFYEYLADFERGHFNLLMTNYEYLSTTGHWSE
ncbi:MAG: ferritin family protein [Chloroflexi bacterium]|nr:ferritin family protein [Chloroflexota bacterium]